MVDTTVTEAAENEKVCKAENPITIKQELLMRRDKLKRQLAGVEEAIAAIEKYPESERVMEIVIKSGF